MAAYRHTLNSRIVQSSDLKDYPQLDDTLSYKSHLKPKLSQSHRSHSNHQEVYGRPSTTTSLNIYPTTLKERAHIGRYNLIRTIGKGNFAKVKLAQHLTTGMEVAIKVIDKSQMNRDSLNKLLREVRIMKCLDHPNIIKLLEVIESEKHLYLVMEYASRGEVFDYLVKYGKMNEPDVRIKFCQIISAVQYCHSKSIVHRDLKAENLLLDENMDIKLADFGFSNNYSLSYTLDTFCGSPPYAAPELFMGLRYQGPEVDVWSLGVILYTLISGRLPFDGKNIRELRKCVLQGSFVVPHYVPKECEQLIRKMIVLNPIQRLPLKEVFNDKWLNNTIIRPYAEEIQNYHDAERIELMVNMGFSRSEINDCLSQRRFNNIMATYILLGRRKYRLKYMKSVAGESVPILRRSLRYTSERNPPMRAFHYSRALTPRADVLTRNDGSYLEAVTFTRPIPGGDNSSITRTTNHNVSLKVTNCYENSDTSIDVSSCFENAANREDSINKRIFGDNSSSNIYCDKIRSIKAGCDRSIRNEKGRYTVISLDSHNQNGRVTSMSHQSNHSITEKNQSRTSEIVWGGVSTSLRQPDQSVYESAETANIRLPNQPIDNSKANIRFYPGYMSLREPRARQNRLINVSGDCSRSSLKVIQPASERTGHCDQTIMTLVPTIRDLECVSQKASTLMQIDASCEAQNKPSTNDLTHAVTTNEQPTSGFFRNIKSKILQKAFGHTTSTLKKRAIKLDPQPANHTTSDMEEMRLRINRVKECLKSVHVEYLHLDEHILLCTSVGTGGLKLQFELHFYRPQTDSCLNRIRFKRLSGSLDSFKRIALQLKESLRM